MAWQEVFPLNVSHIDAEEERELRLASQARAGAEWALAALVARYQPPVTRYLTRLTGDPDASRTLAEHIFIRMEKRLHGPQGGQQLRLWLLRACTESGLDSLRRPHRSHAALRLNSPRMAGLLTERTGEAAAGKLRAGLGALANLTGSTSRQVRQLIWSTETDTPHREPKPARTRSRDTASSTSTEKSSVRRTPPIVVEEDPIQQDPHEALRYRMVRAVLSEIPYGDAQCLALHLIAGLNQAEVAQALGITRSATRRRIVQGLQLFAQRYEAAAASLGISLEALAPAAPRATMPQKLAQTAPAVPAPLPEAMPEAMPEDFHQGLGLAPIEEHPLVAWNTPSYSGTLRATGAPAIPTPPPPEALSIEDVDVGTLFLPEREAAPLRPDEEKTLVIVETTAVVDAIPVIELPLIDSASSSASAETVEVDAVALALAAVEVPARPPELDITEIATSKLSSLEEPVIPDEPDEPDVRDIPAPALDAALDPPVPAMGTPGVEAVSAREDVGEISAPAVATAVPMAVRIVPVLTPALPTPPAATAILHNVPITPATPAADPAESYAEPEQRARNEPQTPTVPPPGRAVPVLTHATPTHAEPAALDESRAQDAAPPVAAASPVRVVPVLTPAALPGAESLAGVQNSDATATSAHVEADTSDASRESVALAAGASDAAAMEAQS